MPVLRITMRKIKEVQRLKLEAKLSHAQIAAALSLSKGVVTKYVGLASTAGLNWSAIQGLDDVTLERQLLTAPSKHATLSTFAEQKISKIQLSSRTNLAFS